MEFLANLHPKVVHFPIALFLLYFIFELIGFFNKNKFKSITANIVLLLAVIASLVAVLSGNQAAEFAKINNLGLTGQVLQSIDNHIQSANLTLWYFFSVLIIRTYLLLKQKFNNYVRFIFIVLAFIGCLFVVNTIYTGSILVYIEQVWKIKF